MMAFMQPFNASTLRRWILLLPLAAGLAAPLWAADQPDPESSQYLSVETTVSAGNEAFNHALRETRSVEITGLNVVIDANSTKNTLHATYENRLDLKKLTIHASEVTIRSPWHLPQTAIEIHAKILRFEGDDATGGRLVTTPVSLRSRPTPEGAGLAGADGLHGGAIILLAQSVGDNQPTAVRLDTTGADGQPAGLGRDGTPGRDMREYNGELKLPSTNAYPAGTVYLWQYRPFPTILPMWWGNESQPPGSNASSFWPGDGGNAVAPGRPGEPGSGGAIVTSQAMPFLSVQGGGLAGARGNATVGGRPGVPNPARQVRFNDSNQGSYIVAAEHTQVKGEDRQAIWPQWDTGFQGDRRVENRPWFHPRMLKAVDLYTADLLTAGDFNRTITYIDTFLADYHAYQQTIEWEDLAPAEKQAAALHEAAMVARRTEAQRNGAEDWTVYR